MGALSASLQLDGWIPIRFFWRDGAAWVDWCHFGARRFSEPFFRDTVAVALREPFNLAFRRETPAEALLEWQAARPGLAPTALVAHASRCGSTLVAQVLAALPGHIALSEASPVDAVVQARAVEPSLPRDVQVAWLRGMVGTLGQPRNGEAALVLKLDAWTIFDFDLVREAFPATPWVYLYRDPLEIAMSQVTQRGSYLVPGVVGAITRQVPVEEGVAMPPEAYIACVIGKMLQAGHDRCRDAGGIPLHYNSLPASLWTTHRTMFAIPETPEASLAMQDASRQDAKNPGNAFARDSERKQAMASDELRSQVERHAAPAYRALEALRLSREAA